MLLYVFLHFYEVTPDLTKPQAGACVFDNLSVCVSMPVADIPAATATVMVATPVGILDRVVLAAEISCDRCIETTPRATPWWNSAHIVATNGYVLGRRIYDDDVGCRLRLRRGAYVLIAALGVLARR
jgi:hypothetical protein